MQITKKPNLSNPHRCGQEKYHLRYYKIIMQYQLPPLIKGKVRPNCGTARRLNLICPPSNRHQKSRKSHISAS